MQKRHDYISGISPQTAPKTIGGLRNYRYRGQKRRRNDTATYGQQSDTDDTELAVAKKELPGIETKKNHQGKTTQPEAVLHKKPAPIVAKIVACVLNQFCLFIY